ncbi:MAG: glycosyltransferase [Lachnospiraceae bacterium]|nr:glycosyltransferase [Lachnospiraceae bacterium]
MKSAEDLISVVIPVYNVKPFLRMCADSVFSQTFRNLEIIFVDDGSTDGSGEMCDELAKEDSRVRVIHQENGGLSAARNTGIDASTGAWLYFLDSDDAISSVTIAHLWTSCIRTKADVSVGDFMRFSEREVPEERRKFTSQSMGTEEALRRMLMNEGFGHQAWGKLFKRELWESLRYPKGLLYEDYAVIYDVMLGAKKIAAVTDALYFYRMQEGSIMHSKIGERNLTLLDTSERVTKMLSEHYPSLRGPAVRLQVVTYMRFLSDMLETDYRLFPDVQKRIIETVRGLKKEFLHAPGVRRVDKMKLRALMAGKRVFYLMYKASDAKKH